MDPWVWWVIAAIVLGIIEVATGVTLIALMLAAGALAAAGAAALTGSDVIPWVVFAVSSTAMIALVRPVAHRHLRTPIETRSGTAALVGAEALVTAQVDSRDGRVKLRGELWSARSYDGRSVYAEGDSVQVLAIEGATALVG
jgi:membrane protein implicated in regulation of membrane protease activity